MEVKKTFDDLFGGELKLIENINLMASFTWFYFLYKLFCLFERKEGNYILEITTLVLFSLFIILRVMWPVVSHLYFQENGD